jgi:hypothetical protein
MVTIDRYSKTLIVMSGGALLSAFFYKNGEGNLAAAFTIHAFKWLFSLFIYSTCKITFVKSAKKRLNPEYKGENDCKFSRHYKIGIDGIKVKGKRYKLVNGTNICLNEKDEIVPCGLGSSIMPSLGGGGLEPKSVQTDECWL